MQIDITRLLTHNIEKLPVSGEVIIPKDYQVNTLISDLLNISFQGKLVLNEEDSLVITGLLKGTMVLPDDLTLEPVEYKFYTEIEEIFDNVEKTLDITDVLWQNILVEIPSKVRSTSEDISLEGDGWRVISEDKFNEERNKLNNPFSNLDELLNTKEDR